MSVRDTKWMCEHCGYVMDSTHSPGKPGAVPKEDDVAMCMNCTSPYVRHSGKWERMTAKELADLPAEIAEQMMQAAIAIKLTVGGTLVKDDGKRS